MALAATLATMRTRVRQQTDQVDSPFISDAELTNWINDGIAHVWQLLITADPDRGTATTTIATTAGTELYTLPSDFLSMRGLDYPLTNGNYANVQPYSFKERNNLTVPGIGVNGAPCRYRVALGSLDGTGVRLSLRPDPGTVTLQLHYVVAPALLVNDADDFDGIVGFEQYPINWAARCVRAKCEEDSSSESASLSLITEQIQSEAPRRDRSGQQTIARVRNRFTTIPTLY